MVCRLVCITFLPLFLLFFGSSEARSDEARVLTGPMQGIKNVLWDTGDLCFHFFDWDTVKVIGVTVPLYTMGRIIDSNVHRCFYNKKNHKNIHRLPSSLCTIADEGFIAASVLINAGLMFGAHDERLRQTSILFLIGLPFIALITHGCKEACYGEFCLRPLHGTFCKDHHRKRGGFPSTHAAACTFVTTLYGKQFGPVGALPWAIMSGFVLSTYVIDNRHYLSQLVAGGGLGVIFALSADKVVNDRMAFWDLKVQADVAYDKSPALKVSWAF